MYKPVKVHIPEKVHERLKSLVAQDKVMPVKIELKEGDDTLLLTPGQIIKMENAKSAGKKSVIFDSVEDRYEPMSNMKEDFLVHSCRWLQKLYQHFLPD